MVCSLKSAISCLSTCVNPLSLSLSDHLISFGSIQVVLPEWTTTIFAIMYKEMHISQSSEMDYISLSFHIFV